MQNDETVPITIEFRSSALQIDTTSSLTPNSGGLEILFSNQKKYSISLPAKNESGEPANVAFLVRHLCEKVMKDPRRELFVLDGTVRPGILVLINEADWELEGEDKYEVQKDDHIMFVSTLHGG
ncbi:Nn.00g000530.m01.CDS01 [Neocucurbitaria sp. VM-36]